MKYPQKNNFSNNFSQFFYLSHLILVTGLISSCNQLSANLPQPTPVVQPSGSPTQNQNCSNIETFNFGGTAGSVFLSYEWKSPGSLQIKARIIPDFKADSYTISLLPSKQSQTVPLEDGQEHSISFSNVASNERIFVGFRQKLGPAQFGGGGVSAARPICN